MTTKVFVLAILLFTSTFAHSQNKKVNKDIVKENFEFASKQFQFALTEMKKAVENETDSSINVRAKRGLSELVNPRSINEDGTLIMIPSKDWCSGFFPGELWYMYEYTKDPKWKYLAHRRTIVLEREKFDKGTHDMGFKMYCSYGNAYRLTNDDKYKTVLLKSAQTLLTRYNPNVGAIKSWDFNEQRWSYPVIIDNMMNLELLFWASKMTGDQNYRNAAENHALTTIKNHFRTDFSTYHVVDYDIQTGKVREKITWQGHSDQSAWARGQAWGLYGYTMCYRETGKPEFLEQAKHIANFIFTHPNLPTDLIPYWDYNAPNIPDEPRDVSAATCTASALYELSMYDEKNAQQYVKWANTIIENVSKNYRAKLNSNCGFLLLHSTGSKPGKFEVDKPLVYADYYYLEALLRKQKLETTNTLFK